ncbi:MAG TPA: aminotransferase, partial [Rhodobacteraceae bacterium]|nr:aminotransferase [Paracoccaceae bacterium]
FQFLLLDWPAEKVRAMVDRAGARGVELKWFGGAEPTGFTSRYDSWRYAPSDRMPQTDRVLAGLIDLRLPLTFSLEDCALIARIIKAEVAAVFQAGF